MTPTDLATLSARPLSVLRISQTEWEAIADKRNQGRRFSLHFPHSAAKSTRRDDLVLVSTPAPQGGLLVAIVRSIGATSTLDTRVNFDLVSPIEPGSLEALTAGLSAPSLRGAVERLGRGTVGLGRVSEKLGQALIRDIAARPANAAALRPILGRLRQPRRIEDARALQQDAVNLAIKAFGGADARSLALPGDTTLAAVRAQEDAVIEHDARWMPGWTMSDSELTGHAVFQRGKEQLDVYTANKRPLEKLFGVDLIYLNQRRGALLMVQYKMLETADGGSTGGEDEEDEEVADWDGDGGPANRETSDREWLVRINDQFQEELERMRVFSADLDPTSAYRLCPGAFYFKLVRRNATTTSAGIILSLGHLDHMLDEGQLAGPLGGLRISYQDLDGHYLRSEAFIELVRSGYVGTRGATTSHMQALIQASLIGGKAVVAAIQTALDPDPSSGS